MEVQRFIVIQTILEQAKNWYTWPLYLQLKSLALCLLTLLRRYEKKNLGWIRKLEKWEHPPTMPPRKKNVMSLHFRALRISTLVTYLLLQLLSYKKFCGQAAPLISTQLFRLHFDIVFSSSWQMNGKNSIYGDFSTLQRDWNCKKNEAYKVA